MREGRGRILLGGGLISAGTLLTRLLGLVRELLTAAFFGSGAMVDAFVVAFSVPGLFRRVLGEEMFERAFMPPFRRLREEGREAEARTFLLRILLLAFIALTSVCGVLYLLLPWLIHLLAPGMSPETSAEALSLARMVLPFLFLIGLSAFLGAVLQFSGRLLLFSMAPALTNLIIILSLILLHRRLSIRALVVGWLLGAAGALLIQLPAVLKILQALEGGVSKNVVPPVTPAVKEGGHILVASLVSKSVEVVDRVFASLVGTGAISALYFSFRLVHLPFSVLSLALSRSLAPEFSRLRGRNDGEGFASLVDFGIRVNLVVLAPVVIFLMFFSTEVVSLFYGRGAFGAESILRTSRAYFFYAPAILAMGLIALLNRVYASLEDNRLPLLAALAGALMNIALDALLWSTPLRQGGIALASSLGLSLQSLVMLFFLGRRTQSRPMRKMLVSGLKLLPALIVLGLLLWGLKITVGEGSDFLGRLGRLGVSAIISGGIYAAMARLVWPRRSERDVLS